MVKVKVLAHVGTQYLLNWLQKNLKLTNTHSCSCSFASVMSDSMTLWTVAHQAPLSIEFSRQYWSELPCPSPGDLLTQWWNPCFLCLLHCRWFLYHQATREAPNTSGSSVCKESAYSTGDPGSIPELGRSFGEGNGKPLQYSCLGNPMDRGA